MGKANWKQRFSRINLLAGRVAHTSVTVAIATVVLIMWYNATKNPSVETKTTTDARAVSILRNLRTAISNGAAEDMQNYFPEGACFLHTLYGLAWANLAKDQELRDEGLREIRQALKGQESSASLEPFRWDTQVRKGAFWLGQRNLVLASYIALEPQQDDTLSTLTAEFHTNSEDFYQGIMNAPVHQLESYDGMCWPADAPMGLASLVIHDDLYGTTYSEAMHTWTDYHRKHGWKESVLPPGKIDFKTGRHLEPARGCANSLMIAVLAPYAPEYASAMYRDYTKHFLIHRCGFAMFREYPPEHTEKADVDSGPIIMGAGVTATGVGLAASRTMGDKATEEDIRDLSDMFGFRQTSHHDGLETSRYLGGLLPIGDAFLAWGYSVERPTIPLVSSEESSSHRWIFHLIVIVTLTTLTVQWIFLSRLSRRRMQRLNP